MMGKTRTAFTQREGVLHLERLCGQPLARPGGTGNLPATRGLAVVKVDGRRYEADDLAVESAEIAGCGARCRWRVGATDLRLEAVWAEDRATGVVSRRDVLINTGATPVTLGGCLARVVLPQAHYACYVQSSQWCCENQGGWQDLRTGLRLAHVAGRTTEGATPYLAIRRRDTREGLVLHVLPCGNWTVRVTAVPEGGEPPFAAIELGLSDDTLQRTLAPGARFELPEILCHELAGGEPHLAAPALQRYALQHGFAAAKPEAPVIYNTWFDLFEILDVPRLRRQLAAAKEVGCEAFVVDAGWYGDGTGDWYAQAGDWREKTAAAFGGRMREFADEVRAAGLGFGLWMEPERFGPAVPVRVAHPEWFVANGPRARLDLSQAPARAWLRGEIGRLVETYRLAWMKVDFNASLGRDDSGAELADYYRAWYELLDEVRAAYPGTFFEGCASGAMRGDLETLRHFDGHFLSDTVNPIDMLRISQGAWLRLPPGRISRWAVLRNAGQVAPRYGHRLEDSPPVLLASGGALWDTMSIDMDLALTAALPGMFGLSGDLASLSPGQRARVATGVAWYKRWRRLITRAVAYPLTEPGTLDQREGWIGLQLQADGADTSLVFVYALGRAGAPPPLRLQGLDCTAVYALSLGLDGTALGTLTGAELMGEGLDLDRLGVPRRPGSVIVVEREGRPT